jgi:hypothetical protein
LPDIARPGGRLKRRDGGGLKLWRFTNPLPPEPPQDKLDKTRNILAPLAYGMQAYNNSPQRKSSNNFAPTSGAGSSRVIS